MRKILIIEDEEDLANGMEIHFAKDGYKVLKSLTGEEGINLAINEHPDLIILDIMLPGINGLDVCRELRNRAVEIPIIILTAKNEEIDRVVGLEIGADDYVTKPFSIRELLARVRLRMRSHSPRGGKLGSYRFGNVKLDFNTYQAKVRNRDVELTQKEFDILHFMIQHRGEVLHRERLLNEVWGYDDYPTTRTVDTHILKLRKKLEDDPSNPKYILSIYGGGYKFIG